VIPAIGDGRIRPCDLRTCVSTSSRLSFAHSAAGPEILSLSLGSRTVWIDRETHGHPLPNAPSRTANCSSISLPTILWHQPSRRCGRQYPQFPAKVRAKDEESFSCFLGARKTAPINPLWSTMAATPRTCHELYCVVPACGNSAGRRVARIARGYSRVEIRRAAPGKCIGLDRGQG